MSSKDFDFDLFVIGGGSGGVRTARIAASHGASVAIAEEYRWGGTCVIRGCVPKKLFVYASSYAREFRDAKAYGWNISPPSFDWSRLIANKDTEIERLSGLYLANLERHHVRSYDDRARLVNAHTISCGNHTVTAKNILIASGGRPRVPEIPGAENIITSDEAFHLKTLPKRIAVAGGGYIGIEFAHIFAGLGCEVTLVHRRDQVLRGFDEDICRVVKDNLAKAGIATALSTTISEISGDPQTGLIATLSNGSKLEVDQVMCAIGRVPNTADLGLEKAGVATNDAGAIIVDDSSRTNVKGIYAVGDCTPRPNLTPVAIRDGHKVADALFGDRNATVDHTYIPTAIFAQPEAATVGITEQQARDRDIHFEMLRTDFRPMRSTLAGSDERIMIKLIIDKDNDQVIGAHMVGRDAAEIIQTFAVAVKRGLTRAELNDLVPLHPTTAEELVLL